MITLNNPITGQQTKQGKFLGLGTVSGFVNQVAFFELQYPEAWVKAGNIHPSRRFYTVFAEVESLKDNVLVISDYFRQ